MAMVKVCDFCKCPIIKNGARILIKQEGQDTITVDACEKCAKPWITLAQEQLPEPVVTPVVEPVAEVKPEPVKETVKK